MHTLKWLSKVGARAGVAVDHVEYCVDAYLDAYYAALLEVRT